MNEIDKVKLIDLKYKIHKLAEQYTYRNNNTWYSDSIRDFLDYIDRMET